MPIANIGEYYDSDNVLIGSAVGFIAAKDTPDPADSVTVFDPAVWTAQTLDLDGPTAGSFTLTFTGGPFPTPVTTAAIAFDAVASAVKSAIETALGTGYTATVTGGPGDTDPFVISVAGSRFGEVTVSVDGTGLTSTGTETITDSPWEPAGATEQGWQVNWNPTTQNITIDEQQTPVDQQMTEAILTFVANLSEDTVKSWGFAINADKTVVAPGAGVFGKTILTPARTLKRYKVVLETQSRGEMPVRWIVDEMVCAANVGSVFRRPGPQRLVPVTFTSVCPREGIQRIEITAAAT